MENYHKVTINMEEFCDIIAANKIVPKNIMEIGSLHGRDAAMIEQRFHTNDVTIFEAHPVFYENIKKSYPDYKVFNLAISNSDKEIEFNCIKEGHRHEWHMGTSSVFDRKGIQYYKHKVLAKRMDTFIDENSIKEIDVLKIDVEGHSYELLEGFGDKLKIVKVLHIENEHVVCWENQKLYADVEKILINAGFCLVAIKAIFPQTDSVWIKREIFNPKWWYSK
jgi:FkbM family methyltransferase